MIAGGAHVVIVDEQPLFGNTLGHSFSQLGYSCRCEARLEDAFENGLEARTALVIAELVISGTCLLDFLPEIRLRCPQARVVVVTAQPSIATAVRAIRVGVDAYLAKPVSAPLVLESLVQVERPQEEQLVWPSLDRTIWEYLNHVRAASGSMSEAARRLGVDRRSLRRMLAKHPPGR